MSATATMHAHRCEACAANGKSVVWIHSDTCAGKIAAHKCPQCGEVQWKKFMVEPGQLPQARPQNTPANFNTVLGYVLFALLLAIAGYCTFLYVKKLREKGAADAITV